MNNNLKSIYSLFGGLDISKGKADAALLLVYRDRNKKPKFLRKRISFKFTKSEIDNFLDICRSYADSNCTSITFAMEVTGIYSDNCFNYIKDHLNDNESVHFLNTQYVDNYRKTHNIPKSDPLDAQTIARVIGLEYDVKYVNKCCGKQKRYDDLKAYVHRYYQLKKTHSQELNRLIATCDRYFPELQYVFDTKSATYLAVLSSYPVTHDIIVADKSEVFKFIKDKSKGHFSEDKIDNLFNLCNDSLVPDDVSPAIKELIISQAKFIIEINNQLKDLEKQAVSIASEFEMFEILKSLTGCGNITAATVISEIGDISHFKNADKLASYMGITPKIDRSGTSVEKMGKITKKGSRYLRHAVFMIAEFARRHNPVLKAYFERIKNGNRKRHKLAVIAVANKIAHYIYSMMKNQSVFVIQYDHLKGLPEETRNTFFNSITTDIPEKSRRQIYRYSDENGEVHKFIYL